MIRLIREGPEESSSLISLPKLAQCEKPGLEAHCRRAPMSQKCIYGGKISPQINPKFLAKQ